MFTGIHNYFYGELRGNFFPFIPRHRLRAIPAGGPETWPTFVLNIDSLYVGLALDKNNVVVLTGLEAGTLRGVPVWKRFMEITDASFSIRFQPNRGALLDFSKSWLVKGRIKSPFIRENRGRGIHFHPGGIQSGRFFGQPKSFGRPLSKEVLRQPGPRLLVSDHGAVLLLLNGPYGVFLKRGVLFERDSRSYDYVIGRKTLLGDNESDVWTLATGPVTIGYRIKKKLAATKPKRLRRLIDS